MYCFSINRRTACLFLPTFCILIKDRKQNPSSAMYAVLRSAFHIFKEKLYRGSKIVYVFCLPGKMAKYILAVCHGPNNYAANKTCGPQLIVRDLYLKNLSYQRSLFAYDVYKYLFVCTQQLIDQ